MRRIRVLRRRTSSHEEKFAAFGTEGGTTGEEPGPTIGDLGFDGEKSSRPNPAAFIEPLKFAIPFRNSSSRDMKCEKFEEKPTKKKDLEKFREKRGKFGGES